MNGSHRDSTPLPAPAAAAIACGAFAVPLALSISSTPSPDHPRTMLWYRSLRQPGFKPPDVLFPLVWSGIEAGLAVAGYRLLRAPPSAARSKALALWGWNVGMIGGWSRVFFKRHKLGLSTVAAAGLLGTSVAFVQEARHVDKVASRAGLALAGWVAFATALTAALWQLNPGRSR